MMKSNPPKITVLMPVYNGENHLREAMDSVLGQTFRDFEFLIINDGSTDRSADLIRSCTDPRIRLIDNKNNHGVVASLNEGLDCARGEFIARMDCDDISLPKRFEKQLNFLEKNKEVAVCGAWMKTIGSRKGEKCSPPTGSAEIRGEMLFNSAIVHPTVMFRKEALGKFGFRYDSDFLHAEDYDLWTRMANFMPLANLGEILHLYRIHHAQIGAIYHDRQIDAANKVRLRQLMGLGISPSADELDLHMRVSTFCFEPRLAFLEKVEDWLRAIVVANRQSRTYDRNVLEQIVGRRWWFCCRTASSLGQVAWKTFWQSPLAVASDASRVEKLKFLAHCLK